MAYRKQKQRILAGSLNLLPPGDLTPEPDSIRLENWRVDKAGALHSRKGVVAAATGLPGPVHSLFRIGDDRYGGAGEELRYGRDLSVQVQLGFDGQPLGFAAMSGMAWVMNRAKRGKVRGATWYEWVPAPPTEAPTVAAGAERTLTVAEFESPEWWDVFYRAAGSDVWQSSPIYVDVAADEGTVAVTNGSKQVVGTGTNWDATMVGKDIRIYTDDPDVVVVTVVESVQDATHLTLETPYDQATASGLSYQISETKYSNQTDGNDKISGSFSQILNAFWPGFWRLAPASDWAFGPKDLRFDGKANDDDVFRLWIKSDTPESIASVTVTFLSGSGATRQGVSATIPASKFAPATGEWMRVEIRRRLDPYSLVNANQEYQDLLRRMQAAQERGNQVEYDTLNQQRYELFQQIVSEAPYFSNVSGETGAVRFDWSDVTEMRIDVETTKSCVVHVDLAEWVAKVDGALEGEYRFYVTYEDIHGHESNPSPASEPVTLDKQPAALSNIPVSGNPHVKRRHIYGIGGPLDRPLRFGTIWDNERTTFTVEKSVETVQNEFIEMPTTHDPPPPARGLLGPYLGRLIAWSSEAHPNRLWWSEIAKPWAWPGGNDESEGNWVDVGDADEAILHVTHHRNLLIIYKERSIWRIAGDPNDVGSDPERTNAGTGALGPQAVCSAGSYDYFAGRDGIYRFNGDYEEKVSIKVDPVFKSDWLDTVYTVPPMSQDQADKAVLAYRQGRLFLSYPEAGKTSPSVVLVYEESAQTWTHHRFAVGGGAFTVIYDEGGGIGHALLGGTQDGGLYRVGEGAEDAGQPMHLTWQSPHYDQGIPDNDKVFADLVVDYRTALGEEPSSLTVKLVYDNGEEEAVGTLRSGERVRSIFPLGTDDKGRRAVNASVIIEGDVSSTVIIYAVYLHWYAEVREALTFDSGVVDLGTEQVKLADEIEFDIEAEGTVAWEVHTDLPGGAMAQRASGQWQPVAGRQTHTVRFLPVEGRKLRLLVVSQNGVSKFRLHGIRIRVLPIGEYVDGAAGDYWESQPVGAAA